MTTDLRVHPMIGTLSGFIIPDDEDHSLTRSTIKLLVERRGRRCLEGERDKENHSGHKWELLHMYVLNQRELVHIFLQEPFPFGSKQKLCLQEEVGYVYRDQQKQEP
jgi:hypothetical protein